MQLKGLTVILICASGGAMQEGILSLMQMAKFLPLHVHQSCANLYISVLYNLGGVTASSQC
jgi:acetyl-CoA carboxylase beta subunit